MQVRDEGCIGTGFAVLDVMARPARSDVLGSGPATVHLTTRVHNGDYLLADVAVKVKLYLLLFVYKLVFGILIYDYCFMDNHIHLILFAPSAEALSAFIHQVLSQLARFINKREGRRGQVFMDRARTPVIQDGKYFLTTMRYIDNNPVRARMVDRAHAFEWSGYRFYAYGERDDLIDMAPEYEGLSPLAHKRRFMYRELINSLPDQGRSRLPEQTVWTFIGDPAWVLGMLVKRGLIKAKPPPAP